MYIYGQGKQCALVRSGFDSLPIFPPHVVVVSVIDTEIQLIEIITVMPISTNSFKHIN